jgi:hypothetical protein
MGLLRRTALVFAISDPPLEEFPDAIHILGSEDAFVIDSQLWLLDYARCEQVAQLVGLARNRLRDGSCDFVQEKVVLVHGCLLYSECMYAAESHFFSPSAKNSSTNISVSHEIVSNV